METKALDGQLIVRYLLGDLPEEEQARLEDCAFANREYLRNIEDAENDLIDDYVRGALTNTERTRFESCFLASAERQKKVEFARALVQVIPSTETSEVQLAVMPWWESLIAFFRGWNPALQFSLAAASLLLAFGIVWLFNMTRGLRTQVAQLQAAQQAQRQQEEMLRQQTNNERARNEDLTAQLERERAHNEELARQLEHNQVPESTPTAPFFASLFLPPGIARGSGERSQLEIPSTARMARFQIGLERGDDFKSYQVLLNTAQGQHVWAQDRLRPLSLRSGRVILLTLPAKLLNAGQYELTLKGLTEAQQTEDVRYYYFDIVKK